MRESRRKKRQKASPVVVDRPDFVMKNYGEFVWKADGRCFGRTGSGPMVRQPERDFGTPLGDLLVDPWMQDISR